ncbi:MAG: phosphopantetheine-binding protein [Methylacidiphilales bacterium]|nr:phosphopantetheine-binding protein [Candidatus Methylacidiphilales bacterium]
MTFEEILQGVKEETAGALGIEPAEISETHLLVADLGAESIDFIDLTFRLEKRFHFDIPEGELFESSATPASQLNVRSVAEYIQKLQP